TVKIIGADGQVLDIELAKRTLIEEIVVATRIPAWLLGYTWSTTERLSVQQDDALKAFIEALRRMVETSIRRHADLQVRLQGEQGAYDREWPDISLRDAVETAKAELLCAQARAVQLRVAVDLWKLGVWDQAQVAEDMTGDPAVVTPLDVAPTLTPEPAQPQ